MDFPINSSVLEGFTVEVSEIDYSSPKKKERIINGCLKWKPVDKQAAMLATTASWIYHQPQKNEDKKMKTLSEETESQETLKFSKDMAEFFKRVSEGILGSNNSKEYASIVAILCNEMIVHSFTFCKSVDNLSDYVSVTKSIVSDLRNIRLSLEDEINRIKDLTKKIPSKETVEKITQSVSDLKKLSEDKMIKAIINLQENES